MKVLVTGKSVIKGQTFVHTNGFCHRVGASGVLGSAVYAEFKKDASLEGQVLKHGSIACGILKTISLAMGLYISERSLTFQYSRRPRQD